MTDAIHPPGSPPDHRRVAPLPGLLVAESEHDVSVRVTEGTWTFRRSDVVRIADRDSPATEGAGRPVVLDIRPGATAEFTRKLRIELTDRPMTLPGEPSATLGEDVLQRLTESWAQRLRLANSAASITTHTFSQTKSLARSDDGTACDSLD